MLQTLNTEDFTMTKQSSAAIGFALKLTEMIRKALQWCLNPQLLSLKIKIQKTKTTVSTRYTFFGNI